MSVVHGWIRGPWLAEWAHVGVSPVVSAPPVLPASTEASASLVALSVPVVVAVLVSRARLAVEAAAGSFATVLVEDPLSAHIKHSLCNASLI